MEDLGRQHLAGGCHVFFFGSVSWQWKMSIFRKKKRKTKQERKRDETFLIQLFLC